MMKNDYKKIFWRTGQEITPETFIQADQYICDQQNLIRKLLNRQYYGLLPVNTTATSSLIINASLDGSDVHIEQLSCNAITKEGYLITFDDELLSDIQQNRLSLSSCPQGIYYVVLRIFPFENTLLEPVDNEETPYALPVFEFDLKTLTQITGNEMPVLKIDYNLQQPKIDRNYIPPCMSINAYERLLENFKNLKKLASEILSPLMIKKEQYPQLVYFASMMLFDLDQFTLNDPPFYLIQLLKKFLKTIGYYAKQLRREIEEAINAPYHHDDISGLLQLIAKCFKQIQQFFGEDIEEDFTPKI